MPEPFVHLHNHSEYSLLDGANRVKDLVQLAVDSGMPAVALTDHGNISGAVEFATRCQDAGIKPLVGLEAYTSGARPRTSRDPKLDRENFHLVLLAQNETGYRNLMKLTSLSNIEGFYYKPRVDHELLGRYNEGLVATSACLGGEICSLLLGDRYDAALDRAATYRDIFGAERFFIEMQDHGQAEDKLVNPQLVDIAGKLGLKTIATNDVHYARREDANPHDTLLCIQTSSRKLDSKRMRYPSEEFWWKSRADMERLFPKEPLDNTLLVADMCDFTLTLGDLILPHYEVPEGHTYETWFEACVQRGALRRYPEMTPQQRERIEYEMRVIKAKGYAAYFLIVADFVKWAHEQGIPARCRGSAAGSVVSYCLDITNADPLKYGLMFERFFYMERITPPDIDLDFADYRRDEVIRYCREKYGPDHVAQIVTFSTLGARVAIRDVCRALQVPIPEADKMSRLIPVKQGKVATIDQALKDVPELAEMYEKDGAIREVLDTVRSVEGLSRNSGVHAAGVVITPGPVHDYCPVQRIKDSDWLATQYDMNMVSKIGLLKMDFLGLRTLTVVDQCIQLMRKRHPEAIPKDFDIDAVPDEDPKTIRLLQSGQTAGVFQLESSGMRRLVQDVRPERIADIIPLVALYRPGPLGNGDTERFIRRRHGIDPSIYADPSLEPYLQDTHGIFVYQDQILAIAMHAAGMGAKDADDLLRAMSKKKYEVLSALKPAFVKGIGEKSNVPHCVAEEIWGQMESFAAYGFNRNHSGAYAILSYQTAWLKANYPLEFMAALLTSISDDTDRVAIYTDECRQMGIPVRLPDVNASEDGFSIDGTGDTPSIYFGLGAIKGVGDKAVAAVLKARKSGPFTSLFDFCMRIDIRHCHKAHVGTMIRAGAFDSLHPDRATTDAWLEVCFASAQLQRKDRSIGQGSLFELSGDGPVAPPMPADVRPWADRELLRLEKEALGLYVSGHPLNVYRERLSRYEITTLDAIGDYEDGDVLLVAGLVTEIKNILTKKDRKPMAFVSLEDARGRAKVTIFPRTWAACGHLVQVDEPLVIRGKVQVRERTGVEETGNEEDAGNVQTKVVDFLADDVRSVDDLEGLEGGTDAGRKTKTHPRLYVDITEASKADIERMKALFKERRGESELVLRRNGNDLVSQMRVAATAELERGLVSILGRQNVWA